MNMFQIARLIEYSQIPYYITVGGDDRVLFKYPPGTIEMWKKMLDDLIEEDMRLYPDKVRNGEELKEITFFNANAYFYRNGMAGVKWMGMKWDGVSWKRY